MPIGMSVPAPSRDSIAASADCSTMKSVTPWSRARAFSARWTSASTSVDTTPPAKVATAGRGRSVGSASSSGKSANTPRQ